MLEIVNELPKKRIQEIDNFLSYLGIYEDKKRNQALIKLLNKEYKAIRGKIGVEAGAGLGIVTQSLLNLGAKKIYAVEENDFCFRFLKEKFKKNKKVEVVHERIEKFRPFCKIDFLFQELYGPLLLDESILALDKLKFRPEIVIPNEGAILVEELKLKDLKDRVLDKKIINLFRGALVTDLFMDFCFKRPKIFGKWKFGEIKNNYCFKYRLKKKAEVIALGMEIWHNGRRIVGTEDAFNWPYVFTPVGGGSFEIFFSYLKGYTKVYFRWSK